jgi:hypothetical protein
MEPTHVGCYAAGVNAGFRPGGFAAFAGAFPKMESHLISPPKSGWTTFCIAPTVKS